MPGTLGALRAGTEYYRARRRGWVLGFRRGAFGTSNSTTRSQGLGFCPGLRYHSVVHSSPVFFDFAKSLDDLQAVLLSFEDIINSRAEQLRSGILISTIFICIFIVFMVPVLPEKYFTTEFSGYIPSRPVPEVLKIYNYMI